jgi:hypothetical protein
MAVTIIVKVIDRKMYLIRLETAILAKTIDRNRNRVVIIDR